MQMEEAPADYIFKLWPWVENNKVRLIWGGGVVLVIAGLVFFHSSRVAQREKDAGEALTRMIMGIPRNATAAQQADLYLKVNADYPGTPAGQRAMLQGATMLFVAGKYPEAQAKFQQFLDANPGSFFAAHAALGLASSLDAQGKADLAAPVYQRIINVYTDAGVVDSARFALAQIDERQGKLAEAVNLYEAIVRYNQQNSTLGTEASLRLMDLKARLQSARPAAAPSRPNR
jgi:TolA-binding protein